MNPQVLRRFIFLMALLTLGGGLLFLIFGQQLGMEPGDFETKLGDQRLEDKLYDEALAHFDQALVEAPDHRGALMGRALVFIQTERYDDAIAELDYLIEFLTASLGPDDPTGWGVLAAAYANRGIVYDRLGQYEKALESYVAALKTDEDTVSGPGVVHKILYGGDYVSTVRERAVYLDQQLKLPEEERLLRVPELDEKQRMHKP
ncbi:MAG: tetratricopeptide repeat protein [Kiloniellales bacterium]